MQGYNFAIILYGFEIWPLTLRGGHRLRILENRTLREIFGPERDENKFHNENLHNLYLSENIFRMVMRIRRPHMVKLFLCLTN
jgi:hypothetical protein